MLSEAENEDLIAHQEWERIQPFIGSHIYFSLERKLNYLLQLKVHKRSQPYKNLFNPLDPNFEALLKCNRSFADSEQTIDKNWFYGSIFSVANGWFPLQKGKLIFVNYQERVSFNNQAPNLVYAPSGAYIQGYRGKIWFAPEGYFVDRGTLESPNFPDLFSNEVRGVMKVTHRRNGSILKFKMRKVRKK